VSIFATFATSAAIWLVGAVGCAAFGDFYLASADIGMAVLFGAIAYRNRVAV
jgi:hypothetical protein